MNEISVFNIAKLAVKSIINIASIYPKPGLITPLDRSALDGTDYPTLIDGTMALFQSCVNSASVGIETQSLKPEDAYTILRSSGQIGMNDSLRATRGKLSLKGHVFMSCLICASAGKLIAQGRLLTPGALALTAASYVDGICSRDLWPLEADGLRVFTPGEKAYVQYGLEGIRGEAEHGFRLTLKALDMFRSLENMSFREKCAHVLIAVMSENQDTSLATHGGITGLMHVQEEAKRIIQLGGMEKINGLNAIFDFDKDLHAKGLSPKGSAVIMSCVLFIDDLTRMKLTRSGYDE